MSDQTQFEQGGSIRYVTTDGRSAVIENVREINAIRIPIVRLSQCVVEAERTRIEAQACWIDVSVGDNAIEGRSGASREQAS